MAQKEAAERFWDHALALYGRDAAREAFLRLQDRDGADVPMLLWCLWCASEGRGISRETMTAAVAFSSAWRAEAVAPLRTLRKALKSGIKNIDRALSEEARTRIASTEQALERLQMDHLAGLPTGTAQSNGLTLIALYADVAGLSLDAADGVVIAA